MVDVQSRCLIAFIFLCCGRKDTSASFSIVLQELNGQFDLRAVSPFYLILSFMSVKGKFLTSKAEGCPLWALG